MQLITTEVHNTTGRTTLSTLFARSTDNIEKKTFTRFNQSNTKYILVF